MFELRPKILEKIQGGLFWSLFDQTMVSGVNFLTGLLIARFLGIEQFGVYVLMWAIVMFALLVQHAFINSQILTIGTTYKEEEMPIYKAMLYIFQSSYSTGLVVGILILGNLLRYVGGHSLNGSAIFSLAMCTALVVCQDFGRRYFFAYKRYFIAFLIDAIRYPGQILIIFYLHRSGELTTLSVLGAASATSAVAIAVSIPLIGKLSFSLGVVKQMALRHWDSAGWLSGAAILGWIATNAYLMTAGALLGSAAVGAIKAAQSLMALTHIIFLGLENHLPVRAAEILRKDGKTGLKAYLFRSTVSLELFTLCVGTVFFIAPEFWLNAVFGESFAGYGYILRWYVLIYLFHTLILPITVLFRVIEETQIPFICMFLMALFSLITCYPLISFFGISGVLIGFVLSRAIYLVYSLIQMRFVFIETN
jgi:O-antigen/teichoic acid export membrane protein